jgi:hypothetical protein
MSSQCVTFINAERQVIATAHVTEQDGRFTGRIELRHMPIALQRLFADYEEIVSAQMFSLLDAVEEQIATLRLTGVFEDGHEAVLTDVQIYPSTKKVSFQEMQGTVSHTGSAEPRPAGDRQRSGVPRQTGTM